MLSFNFYKPSEIHWHVVNSFQQILKIKLVYFDPVKILVKTYLLFRVMFSLQLFLAFSASLQRQLFRTQLSKLILANVPENLGKL